MKQAQKDMEKYGLSADEVAESNRSLGGIIAIWQIRSVFVYQETSVKPYHRWISKFQQRKSKIQTRSCYCSCGTGFGVCKTTIETAKAADEILTLSQTTGLTTDQIQELNYALNF